MHRSTSKLIDDQLDSCVFRGFEKLLRLVATTKTMGELCICIEDLFWTTGSGVKCSFHKQSDRVKNENLFQTTFPSEWFGGGNERRSEKELIADLQLSKVVFISNARNSETYRKDCNCIQVTEDSFLLIPALSSSNGLSWIKIHFAALQANLHISDALIEGLQWAFFIQVERDLHHAICGMSSASHTLINSVFQSKASLTKRQNQIASLVVAELSNDEIATQLHISASLVKLELGRIFKILEIKSRKDLFHL